MTASVEWLSHLVAFNKSLQARSGNANLPA